jgi:winged helix DNA-binding protein
MPSVRTLADDRVRRLRSAAQLLHRPGRRSVVDVVRHLTGVQAQVLPAAALALRARTAGLTAARVDAARLRDRSIVVTWAMRGTLHLIASEDHGWLVPMVTEPRITNSHRRLKQEGVPADQPARAARLIERMLEREGPLTRGEIADRLARRGIRTQGQAIAHLMWLAAAQGAVCYGPDRGADRTFILVRDWLDPPLTMDREAALQELAVRYLRAHAPATPADLAFWSGIRPGDAKRAWRRIEDRLVEVPTNRGPCWAIRSSRNDRLPRGPTRLLPAFDEYLMGWNDRGLTADRSLWTKINRGGGWLHPVLVTDGRAIGTWASERTSSGLRLEVHPFVRPAPSVRRGVVAEVGDIARFLRTPLDGVAM